MVSDIITHLVAGLWFPFRCQAFFAKNCYAIEILEMHTSILLSENRCEARNSPYVPASPCRNRLSPVLQFRSVQSGRSRPGGSLRYSKADHLQRSWPCLRRSSPLSLTLARFFIEAGLSWKIQFFQPRSPISLTMRLINPSSTNILWPGLAALAKFL